MASLSTWIAARVRLARRPFLVGLVLSLVATGLLTVVWDDGARASAVTFSLAALVFGFALVGWSWSVLVGSGTEHLRRHLGLTSTWTQGRSRNAMVRIGAFGVGGLAGASVVAFLVS